MILPLFTQPTAGPANSALLVPRDSSPLLNYSSRPTESGSESENQIRTLISLASAASSFHPALSYQPVAPGELLDSESMGLSEEERISSILYTPDFFGFHNNMVELRKKYRPLTPTGEFPRIVDITIERNDEFHKPMEREVSIWQERVLSISGGDFLVYLGDGMTSAEQMEAVTEFGSCVNKVCEFYTNLIKLGVQRKSVAVSERIAELRSMGLQEIHDISVHPMAVYKDYEKLQSSLRDSLGQMIAEVKLKQELFKGVVPEDVVEKVVDALLQEVNDFNTKASDHQNQFYSFSRQMEIIHQLFCESDIEDWVSEATELFMETIAPLGVFLRKWMVPVAFVIIIFLLGRRAYLWFL